MKRIAYRLTAAAYVGVLVLTSAPAAADTAPRPVQPRTAATGCTTEVKDFGAAWGAHYRTTRTLCLMPLDQQRDCVTTVSVNDQTLAVTAVAPESCRYGRLR